jgi:uncharacterized repeat protein (TIGR02543 family)
VTKDITVGLTVSFSSNGGSAVASQYVANSATAAPPADPTKSGFLFAGWYRDAALTNVFNFMAPITTDFTLYAKWTIAATVTTSPASGVTLTTATLNGLVNPNGASTSVTFDYGQYAYYEYNTPATPYSLVSNASETSVTAAITGLACGTTYHYRVNADNGVNITNGSDMTFNTSSDLCPSAVTEPVLDENVTQTTATLRGTVSSNGAETAVTFIYDGINSATAIESPLALDASNVPVSVVITGLACGTTYYYHVIAANNSVASNGLDLSFNTKACDVPTVTTLSATGITQTGATLHGTVSTNGAETTVTFVVDGVSSFDAVQPNPLTAGTASNAAVSAAIPGLACGTSYSFWVNAHNNSVDAQGETRTFNTSACPAVNGSCGNPSLPPYLACAAGSQVGGGQSWTCVGSGGGTDASCSATQTEVTHTVTFSSNGGSGTMTAQTTSVATALKTNSFTRTGYSFSGWNTLAGGGGTSYADGASYLFAADVTLYAQWTGLPSKTVTFNSNGGSGTMTAQTTNVATALTANSFTRTGYSFSGWNTAAGGGGTSYADGTSYPFTADVTLYAQWTGLPSKAVTFNSNGGSGTMTVQTTNVATALTANSFTRTGYSFSGWNTAAGGGGTGYADGASYPFTADIALYAQWAANTYSWNVGSWSTCAATCGSGTQTRTVECQDQSGTAATDSFCTAQKPVTSQACDTQITCGPKKSQTIGLITFSSILSEGGTTMAHAIGGGSSAPVIFTSQTPDVCTTGGTNNSTITGVASGFCIISADQAGDSNYNAAQQVSQSFSVNKPPFQELTVNVAKNKTGIGTGSVIPSPAPNTGTFLWDGTLSRYKASYPFGTTVLLTANPDNGSSFVSWSGDCISTANNLCQVSISGGKTVTVTFKSDSYRELIVKKDSGTGKGLVSASSGTINWDTAVATGTVSFTIGTDVNLTAVPDSGSELTGWTGCTPSQESILSCSLKMDVNTTVTASFKDTKKPTITSLNVTSPSNTLAVPFTLEADDNTGVTEYYVSDNSAAPSGSAAGWVKYSSPQTTFKYTFTEVGTKTLYVWVRDKEGNISDCSSAAVYIAHPLNISIGGNGKGTVSQQWAGNTVTLTAMASSDSNSTSSFDTWFGDCSGPSTTCTLTVTGQTSVTATFKLAAVFNHPIDPTSINGDSSGNSPSNGETGVKTTPLTIQVKFSRKVKTYAIDDTKFLKLGNTYIPGSGAFLSEDTYSFTPSMPLSYGTTYSYLPVGAITDQAGNPMSVAFSTSFTTMAKPANVIIPVIRLSLSANSTLLDNSNAVNVSGVIKAGANTSIIKNQPVTLLITKPDRSKVSVPLTTNAAGTFSKDIRDNLTLAGRYTIRAFTGSAVISTDTVIGPVTSDAVILRVNDQSGIAIIVTGRLPGSDEGAQPYAKSVSRVKSALKARGFTDADIYEITSTADNSGKQALSAALTTAKQRISTKPAALHLILIDHGDAQQFHMGPEDLTPQELGGMLDGFENGLPFAALDQTRYITIGTCYSGSFITPALAKAGRIIVTSASAGEQSFRGPMEPDSIRGGEYFMDKYFEYLKSGQSVKDAFNGAVDITSVYTRRGGIASSSGDKPLQNPLIGLFGSSVSSKLLSGFDDNSPDSLYLGLDPVLNLVPPQDQSASVKAVFLDNRSSWATISTPALSSGLTAWFEVRSPSIPLVSTGGNVQISPPIYPKTDMTYNATTKRYEGFSKAFTESGAYDITIYLQDPASGTITRRHMALYRNRAGNQPPNAFTLKLPENGDAAVNSSLVATWNKSADPDSDMISYTLLVSRNSDMTKPVLVKEGLTNLYAIINEADGLLDLTQYYWQVWAIDSYGAITQSDVRTFTTDNTNAAQALITGKVTNTHGDPVSYALITVNNGQNTLVLLSEIYGDYAFRVLPGKYSVSVNTDGYKSNLISFDVVADQTLVQNIVLQTVNSTIRTLTKDIVGQGYLECPTLVNDGTQLVCLIQSKAGYKLESISGCNGSAAGNQFTSTITTDCTIVATFSPIEPENGTCGDSSTKYFDTEPALPGLCLSGDPTLPLFDNVSGWSWACKGRYAGNDSPACKAFINVHPLTVNSIGNGGTVTSDRGSISCGSNCSDSYAHGTSVTLTAAAGSGFAFAGWTGDCSGTGVCTVTMDSPRAVSATFIQSFTINFIVGTGGSPGTLSGVISQTVNYGGYASKVTAVPATGYHFVSWTDGANSITTSTELTVNNVTAAATYVANFAPDQFTITTSAGLNGSITAPALVGHGTSKTVTVTPATGYHITQVTVDAVSQSIGNPKFFEVTFNPVLAGHAVSAFFAIDYYALTVNITGEGMVHSNAEASFSCDINSCSKSFPYNTTIDLFATTGSKSTFERWELGCTEKNTCSVIMADNRIVNAIFSNQKPFRINGIDHAHLQGAYKAPAVASKVWIMSGTWPANEAGPMIADENKEITFEGGYTSDFISKTPEGPNSYTIIEGGIYVRAGKVIMKGVKVR